MPAKRAFMIHLKAVKEECSSYVFVLKLTLESFPLFLNVRKRFSVMIFSKFSAQTIRILNKVAVVSCSRYTTPKCSKMELGVLVLLKFVLYPKLCL